jgi:hypothetical protein
MFLHLTLADWIKLAILLLPFIAFCLTQLSHSAYIAKSAAYSDIVQTALHIVSQIEATLQANPNASRAQLVQAGIAELRQLVAPAFAKLPLDPRLTEAELTLLFQRLVPLLPSGASNLINNLLGNGSSSVSGGATPASVSDKRLSFIRNIGARLQ